MDTLLIIIFSTVLVSLLSLIGLITVYINQRRLQDILLVLVAISAGALMGGALLHLHPEALEESQNTIQIFISTLAGFSLFFLIEKVLSWHHCHSGKCSTHTLAYMNLFGDFVHNFIDGVIIAASFITDFALGVTTTLAVFLHEIPQEIGDFGVLLHARFSFKKAILLNFVTALTAVIGGIFGFFLTTFANNLTSFIIPIAAGGFIYISASDLVPEIRKETRLNRILLNYSIFLLGILIMYGLRFLEFS